MKMHTQKEVHRRITETPNRGVTYRVTDPLGENSRNPEKKQENSVLKLLYNNNKHNMSALYKRWKKT